MQNRPNNNTFHAQRKKLSLKGSQVVVRMCIIIPMMIETRRGKNINKKPFERDPFTSERTEKDKK